VKLYFVRHGYSEANRLNEFSNRGLKHGLTESGRQQAATLAQSLAGILVIRLFTSPLLRAIQTAEILSATWGVPYEVTDALREFDCGILEGMPFETGRQLFLDTLDEWRRGNRDRRIDQGESFNDIEARFVPFVEQLVREYADAPDSLVLIGHGGVYRCMLPLVLTNVDFDFAFEHEITNTGAIVAELRPDGLVCTAWCDTAMAHQGGN
jgi:broad specificity phosphatase PhoE